MSSIHDHKDGILNFSQLVIDEDISGVKVEPIKFEVVNSVDPVKIENLEPEEMAVAEAALHLGYSQQFSNLKKMKVLVNVYFTRIESYQLLFNEINYFADDSILSVEYSVYDLFKIRVLIFNSNKQIHINVMNLDFGVVKSLYVMPEHIPDILNMKHISKMLNQIGSCFHPFIMSMLNGKRPTPEIATLSKSLF